MGKVLILIFLEDSFGDLFFSLEDLREYQVLILIFLEDSFGEFKAENNASKLEVVLILIFLEDSFGDTLKLTNSIESLSLNPYFFGG